MHKYETYFSIQVCGFWYDGNNLKVFSIWGRLFDNGSLSLGTVVVEISHHSSIVNVDEFFCYFATPKAQVRHNGILWSGMSATSAEILYFSSFAHLSNF